MSKEKYPRFVNSILNPNPTHPSEILKDELETRTLSVEKLAQDINVSIENIENLLEQKEPFTLELSEKLEAVFDIKASFWLRMQNAYNQTMIFKHLDKMNQ